MEAIETALIASGLTMVILLWAAATFGAVQVVWDTASSLLRARRQKTKH